MILKKLIKNDSGNTVIEVLITLAMISVIIFSIGEAMAANNRLQSRSESSEVAVSLARDYIEIITSQSNDLFLCECGNNGVCAGNQCTSSIDGQVCTLNDDYTNCWLPYSHNLTTNANLHLDDSTGNWDLLDGSKDIILNNRMYSISVEFENILRDNNGIIDELNGNPDSNTKIADVNVIWSENNLTKVSSLSTYITVWENLKP